VDHVPQNLRHYSPQEVSRRGGAHTETERFGQELDHDTPPLGDQFKPFPPNFELGILQSMSRDKAKYFKRLFPENGLPCGGKEKKR